MSSEESAISENNDSDVSDDLPVVVKKRGRPPKLDKEPARKRKLNDDDLDGIHYACNVCDQVFLHKANYLRHSQRHDPPGGFECSLCHQPFTTDWDRSKHRREAHSVFRCRICKDEFQEEADYNKHIQQQHEGRDCDYDICPTCGQQFRSSTQLKVHIETNCSTIKKHRCNECNASYLTQASLNAHMIKHLGEKRHLCDSCGASFLNKGQLKVHERMHTGEKPYKCSYQGCDRAFAHRESLITHSTTHSGIKPYYCSYCQSRFSCIGNLLKHRRARPDTCGLPQYCITNKIVARPNIRTMPNLMDRQKNTAKVVQRSGPPRPRKPKTERDESPEAKPVVVNRKSTPGRKPAVPKKEKYVSSSASSSSSSEEEEEEPEQKYKVRKPTVTVVPPKISFRNTKVETQQSKLVDLKVEPGNSFQGESSKSSYNAQATTSGDIPAEDIKIEEDIETLDYVLDESEAMIDESQEILFETVLTNDDEGVGAIMAAAETPKRTIEEIEEEFYGDQDDSEDYQPPQPAKKKQSPQTANKQTADKQTTEKKIDRRKYYYYEKKIPNLDTSENDSKGVRRHFDEKPEVITSKRHRGRPKKTIEPKRDNENMIIIDLEAKQQELEAQRAIFDANIEPQSADNFRCAHCPMLYFSEYLVGRHLEREHGIVLRELLETLRYDRVFTRDKKYLCRYCQRSYCNERSLEKHVELHGPDRNWIHKCKCCTRYFETEDIARDHALEEHRERLECHLCGKVFREPETLVGHLKYFHEKDKNKFSYTHICTKCGKNLNSRTLAADHERSNCGQNPQYQCQVCLKMFFTGQSLKNHYSLHTDEMPYSCQFCGKAYRTKGQVKVHERQHTGEKPFVCEFCNKAFGHRESLQTHRSSHTGVKRYMCSGCGQRFSCVSNLQAHRRSHKTTCGTVPTMSKVIGDGYHELPSDYVIPYPKNESC